MSRQTELIGLVRHW